MEEAKNVTMCFCSSVAYMPPCQVHNFSFFSLFFIFKFVKNSGRFACDV